MVAAPDVHAGLLYADAGPQPAGVNGLPAPV